MSRKERIDHFIQYFSIHSPTPETELIYNSPYELLVAVVLSAQCTDKRVNLTTPLFFKSFPTPYELAGSSIDTIYNFIKSVSFPNNKAKHLWGMANMLVNEFNGQVPGDVDSLQRLPGVGRKTANVIASVIFDQPTMAVDTHVFRVSKRIGMVHQSATTPLEVEKQLVKYIPQDLIHKSHHWILLHGRYVCVARRPKCEICGVKSICRYFEKLQKMAQKNTTLLQTSP